MVGTIDGSHIVQCQCVMHAAIEKASYCKIAFLPVLSTCSSPMHCVAGKGLPQMLIFGKMQKVSAFQKDVFYWWTQDFHIVKSYLCLIEVVDIIYLKVEANIKGYFYLLINIHGNAFNVF